jgi:adenylylsulfate kinase
MGKKGNIFWLMGPTSSGKTTISETLVKRMRSNNHSIIHFDGDEIRDLLGKSFGFTKENRLTVVSIIVHLALKNAELGIDVIVSALTANNGARQYIKDKIENLKVVYIQCEKDVCVARDPKGLYKKAQNGEIETLIGFHSPYNPPASPSLIINTANSSLEESVQLLDNFIKKNTF